LNATHGASQQREPYQIADQFAHQGQIVHVNAFGSGNINDTFLVTLDDPAQTGFVLQRINHHVFPNPAAVMANMVKVTEHIHRKLALHPLERPWQMPKVIFTKTGQDHWQSAGEDYWRAISFIEGSTSFDTLTSLHQAQEVGVALGLFHQLLSDLPPQQLTDTLPGFHHTPDYLAQYHQAIATTQRTGGDSKSEVQFCREFIDRRAAWCDVLETAKQRGDLPLRLMHGDPKVNNILFDRQTGQAISVIDLDTTKPGLIHYDIGDCLRSGCNPAGEETQNWQGVTFNVDFCNALLQGYLPQCRHFLGDGDYHYLFDAIRLIAFELGLRFFTDYLNGDRYFKVKYDGHNLLRALVQFQLTASIEQQQTTIEAGIHRIRSQSSSIHPMGLTTK
jgi:Ser/Thr protein kinase RdoA (MazF antagonist)